jgi:membrane dipeptidase
LAAAGGVQMVTFVPDFVSQACADHSQAHSARRLELGLPLATVFTDDAPEPADPAAVAAMTQWEVQHPAPTATLADVADHLDHAREVAGVDHIGLGGDYDGVESLPAGLEDVSTYPALLAALADRGWSDADLAGLTSGNILRVMAAAEEVAGESTVSSG